MAQRLSQRAMVAGSQRNLHVNSGRTWWAKGDCSGGRLSSSGALAPTGCRRGTRGAGTALRGASSRPPGPRRASGRPWPTTRAGAWWSFTGAGRVLAGNAAIGETCGMPGISCCGVCRSKANRAAITMTGHIAVNGWAGRKGPGMTTTWPASVPWCRPRVCYPVSAVCFRSAKRWDRLDVPERPVLHEPASDFRRVPVSSGNPAFLSASPPAAGTAALATISPTRWVNVTMCRRVG